MAMVAVCMPALEVEHTRMPAAARPLHVWNAIVHTDKPFVLQPTPTARRRSMSHESLHLCTETLGCETGSRYLLHEPIIYSPSPADQVPETVVFPPPPLEDEEEDQAPGDQLAAVRYHRSRPQRAFPPPLPSISRRDGTCTRMRTHRRDGRLVMEAVPVRPQGYLHARRHGGRLRLCFVDCSSARDNHQLLAVETDEREEEEEEDVADDDDEEEEEDEVELVDRGTVVEVVAASGKAQRSRIVINKFVGGTPVSDPDHHPSRCAVVADDEAAPGLRRVPSSTRTLAAAVAAATTGMDKDEEEEEDEGPATTTTKMLFTSRVGDREELVQSVRRCRQLRQKPLFIVEPYCIATS